MTDDAETPLIRDSTGLERHGQQMGPDSGLLAYLNGRDITFIRIDHQVRLQVDASEIVIESPFVLRDQAGEVRLDPSERHALGPLLACFPAAIAQAEIRSDAALHLTLTDGRSLEVPPDEGYEAWHVNGPGSLLVICMPGSSGQLAVWS